MAPKKRKAVAADAHESNPVNPDHVAVLNKRLEEIDAAGTPCKQQHTAEQQRPADGHSYHLTIVCMLQWKSDVKPSRLQQMKLWQS